MTERDGEWFAVIPSMGRLFADRREAAQRLGESLAEHPMRRPVILGIPRGGIVIADRIATALDADLDIALARKLGAPGNPELAIGAVSENGVVHIQSRIAAKVRADEDYIDWERERQLAEIQSRRERYRSVLSKVPLEGRTAVIVDDGIATGATMQAAIWAMRVEEPSEILVAVPVGAQDATERLEREADAVVCLHRPAHFYAIGQFFEDFEQVADREVMAILEAHSHNARHDISQ